MLTDGARVGATNVVVQVVDVVPGDIIDPAGNPSPEVTQTGRGRAYILLDGHMVAARWERPTLDDMTTYVAKDGTEVTLRPGRTWVELLPSDRTVDVTDAPPPATTAPPTTAAPAKATSQKNKK